MDTIKVKKEVQSSPAEPDHDPVSSSPVCYANSDEVREEFNVWLDIAHDKNRTGRNRH